MTTTIICLILPLSIPRTRAQNTYYQLFPTVGELFPQAVPNATYFGFNLSQLVINVYHQDNFDIGENLTFYCQNVETGAGVMKMIFLDSTNYAAFVASQSYTPLAQLLCDNQTASPYNSYGSMSYNISSIDIYYIIVLAVSTDVSILTLEYKVGFIGALEYPNNPGNDPLQGLLDIIIISTLIMATSAIATILIYKKYKNKEKISSKPEKKYKLPITCPKCKAPFKPKDKISNKRAQCFYCESFIELTG